MKNIFLSLIVVPLCACSTTQFVATEGESKSIEATDVLSGESFRGRAVDAKLDGLRGFGGGKRDAESRAVSKGVQAIGETRTQTWGVSQIHTTRAVEYQAGAHDDGAPRMVKFYQGGNPPAGFYGALPERVAGPQS